LGKIERLAKSPGITSRLAKNSMGEKSDSTLFKTRERPRIEEGWELSRLMPIKPIGRFKAMLGTTIRASLIV
jgi:hypothetical protein